MMTMSGDLGQSPKEMKVFTGQSPQKMEVFMGKSSRNGDFFVHCHGKIGGKSPGKILRHE
jgi:hypothetical protein